MTTTHRTHVTGARVALVAGLLVAAPAAAQDEAVGVCPAGRIEHIFIDNHSIFDTSDPDLDPRFRWAYAAANRLHVRTKEGVIAEELLFRGWLMQLIASRHGLWIAVIACGRLLAYF
mgnify:CR=1 FL=1